MATQTFADVVKHWTEALNPANSVEEHLTTAIARQDFLMYALLKRVAENNQEAQFSKWMRTHRDMASALASLTHTLDTLQRKRLGQQPPPPVAKTKGKLIQFPTAASVGKPARIELETEPALGFGQRYRRTTSRAEIRSLDLKIAA